VRVAAGDLARNRKEGIGWLRDMPGFGEGGITGPSCRIGVIGEAHKAVDGEVTLPLSIAIDRWRGHAQFTAM
jgi:hypothetical protein